MKTLIILAHPNVNSFNHAIMMEVSSSLKEKNHEVVIRDLYEMNFNPILSAEDFISFQKGEIPKDIKREQEYVSWADLLLFIYPIWWNEQPAILKGWIDRVFTHGFAYKANQKGVEGLLKGKKAMVFTTSGAGELDMKKGPIQAIETCMIHSTLGFVGIEDVSYFNFSAVPTSSPEVLSQYLAKVKQKLSSL